MVKSYPTCLTIAGSDSCGGAGIQADLKTMSALGVYGMSVITAITAQNTRGVDALEAVSSSMVKAQLESVFSDIRCDAVKIGMLFSPQIIDVILEILDKYSPRHVVLDPVMVSTSGHALARETMCDALKNRLCNRVSLITPNIPEAEKLCGMSIDTFSDMMVAGEVLMQAGCGAVLIKGGHLSGEMVSDVLFQKSCQPEIFTHPMVDTRNTHGTGCSLSSAIASYLALGRDMHEAVSLANEYVYNGLKFGADVIVGDGHGPINHFFFPVALRKIECE